MWRIAVFIAVLIAIAPAPAARADEWSDALRAYKRDIGPENPTPLRLNSVRAVAMFGTRDAARVLLQTVEATERTERPLEEEKETVAERIQGILGSQQFEQERRIPADAMSGLKELQIRLDRLQQELVAEARVRLEIADALAGFGDPAAIEWLTRSGLKDASARVRETVARALGGIGSETTVEPLRRALGDKSMPVREAALDSLGAIGAVAAVPDVLDRLEDKAWPVRAAAVRALAKLAAKEAVGPLIEALGREDGRLRKDIADALQELTGQGFGVNVEGWRNWWEEHKGEYGGEGGLRVGGRGKAGGVSYYGIETHSKRIVYVLDASGSMARSHDAPDREAQGAEVLKVDAAKRELIRSLKTIPKDGAFTIVVYNDLIKVWDPKLVAASPANKKRAEEFVNGLTAASSTNIYGALDAVFKMAGMGAGDRHYDLGADTVFLLSDGSPTKPDGTMDSTEKIIVACREWNRLKRVTIHCIGIGRAHNGAFMRQLASENGGQYVAR